MKPEISRLIDHFERLGRWGERGLLAEIAKRTGFTPAYVGQVFSGKKEPANKFVMAVCSAYDINTHWVETGYQPATIFAQGVFDKNAPIGSPPRPLKMSEVTQDIIRRLKVALEEKGVNGDSRNKTVADVTGYSIDSAAKVLAGDFELEPDFVLAVCDAFGIDVAWVVSGKSTKRDGMFEDEPGAVEPGLADITIQKAIQSAIVREAILEIMKMPVYRRWEAVGMLKRMNEKDEEQS